MSRPSWDQFFLALAHTYATRATCDRLHVGCILVKNKRLIAAGYNGSPEGEEHCDQVGHLLVENHCLRTIHSEDNAIRQALSAGQALFDTTAYLTHSPCPDCASLLTLCGITRIVYAQAYRGIEAVEDLCSNREVELVCIPLIDQEAA